MDKEQFIKVCHLCGYASKASARKYTEEHKKEDYNNDDFIEVYHAGMPWKGCATHKGLHFAYGINGKTTAMRNGIAGTSGGRQDWR